jgi:hypothetical protein
MTAEAGPQATNTAAPGCPSRHRDVSEISWFQGTLEAFSPRRAKTRGSNESHPMFGY